MQQCSTGGYTAGSHPTAVEATEAPDKASNPDSASPRAMLHSFVLTAMLLVGVTARAALVSVALSDVDSGTTSTTGAYRSLDIADQQYSAAYRASYDYTQGTVNIDYEDTSKIFGGTLTATNLKPNFAYQIKLVAGPGRGPASLEGVGLAGRWWEQKWESGAWTIGANLNTKGDGSSPNPNDDTYYSRRDLNEAESDTGKLYKYTSYMVGDYFVTDGFGGATVSFQFDSSYHVLWKSGQEASHTRDEIDDGPAITTTFDVDPDSHLAYSTDYGERTVMVFGEWERLPAGGITMQPGNYGVQFLLTEESFHGSGNDLYDGDWAAAMGADVAFTIVPEPTSILLLGVGMLLSPSRRRSRCRLP